METDDYPDAEGRLVLLENAQELLIRARYELALANGLIRHYAARDGRPPAGSTPDEYEHLQEVLRG